MRDALEDVEGERHRYFGVFEKFGTKSAYRGPPIQTVLLKDVKSISGDYICDHLWFNYTKGFEKLGELKTGDLVEFDARSEMYAKGYRGRRSEEEWDLYPEPGFDYKLSFPTKLTLRKTAFDAIKD